MKTSYNQTGGARLDMFNATWPFATLSADRENLTLQCLGKTYVFPKNEISELSRHGGIFSVGLRIAHKNPTAPGFVVFWASLVPFHKGFQRLRTGLEELGYAVTI